MSGDTAKYGTFAMTPDELDAFLAEQDVVMLALPVRREHPA